MTDKNNNNNRIPELRFPGFTGDWEYVNGNELFSPISNKDHNSDLPILALTQEQGAVPRELINYKIQVSEKSVEGYKVVDIDDFIISLRSFQGGIEYSRYKGLCSPAYIVLRKKDKNLVSDFYRHYFKSFKYIQDLNKNLEGIRDGKMISFKQFSEIQIPFPSYPEQQKIADFLSSLDELIAAEAQKANALKDHKKGLMQQLFPSISNEKLAMSNCVPKRRFPGFSGVWEVKKLGEVANLSKGKGIAKSDIDIHGQTPCIRYGELYTRYGEQIKTVFSRTNIPSQDLVLGKVNDVIIPSSGETHEDIATASCILVPAVAIGGDINILRSPLNGLFLSYYLNSAKKHEIAHIAQGDAVVHLYGTQLSKLSICFPPTLAEQQKIADCLSELDEMISAQQQKVEALKEHKKGLMQKMFPKMNNTK